MFHLCSCLGDLRCLLHSQDCLSSFLKQTASLLCGFCAMKCPLYHPGTTLGGKCKILPQKKKCSWVPELSRRPRFWFRRCGEVEETGSRDYLMPGRKRPASPSHGCCCWDWAPEVPSPQPMLQLMLTAPASPSPGRFLACRGAWVGMACCDPGRCVQLISTVPSVLSFAQGPW